MIRQHHPQQSAYDEQAPDVFARLNPGQMLREADTPTRVLGVVDEWGKPVDCYGAALFTNGTLGVDLLNIPPNARFPLHTHPGHHLLYCVAGRGTFTLADTVHDVYPGDLFMVEGHVPHAVGSGPDGHVILAYGSPHTMLGSPARMTVILEDDDQAGAAIRASMEADGVKVIRPEEVPWSG